MSSRKKKMGGAEREREKKKARLADEAKKCRTLDAMFSKNAEAPEADASDATSSTWKNINDNMSATTTGAIPTADIQPQHTLTQLTQQTTLIETREPEPSASLESDHQQQLVSETNEVPLLDEDDSHYFQRPSNNEIQHFFEFHPKIPPQSLILKFNCEKAFKTEFGTRRNWLTYSSTRDALFCSVCLAFSQTSDKSAFISGMTDWKHTYQRIEEHHRSVLHTNCSKSYFMLQKNSTVDKLLFSTQLMLKEKNVMMNRQVVDRVINIVKLIGKRGLSYRGHSNEAGYTLKNEELDHGNFLEIVLLISKYDVVLKDHLNKIIPESERQHAKGVTNRAGSFVSFLSKTTVNTILDIICNKMKKYIAEEVRSSGMFSLEFDTTQDVSTKDQGSIILKYVYQAEVHERLLTFVSCHDSTGKGIHHTITSELSANNINATQCVADSTDGAANMQGEYNGLVAMLKQHNEEHVHIWCYSHILNLVVGDIMKACLGATNVFNIFNKIAGFFKESYQRMDIWQNENSQDPKHRKLQSIGETRWWAKESALSKIFGSYGAPQNSLYTEVLFALEKISHVKTMNADVRATARSLAENLQKYEVILIGHIFLKIFSITGPLSRYLQTEGLDLLKATQLAQSALEQLKSFERNFERVNEAADEFVAWAKEKIQKDERCDDSEIEIETSLPKKRTRRVKKMAGEIVRDERVENENDKFRIETFNVIMDTVIQSMENRFRKNFDICKDLAILDPRNFHEIKEKLPDAALQSLHKKLSHLYANITFDGLRDEFKSFIDNWDMLKLNIAEHYKAEHFIKANCYDCGNDCDCKEPGPDRGIRGGIDAGERNLEEINCKACKNCPRCCYTVLIRYNMYQEVYPTLALAYQYYLTLPISQVACERTFSKLKYVKSRLRSTLSDDRLEALMLMSCERSILTTIDNEEIINALARSSTLLSKKLML